MQNGNFLKIKSGEGYGVAVCPDAISFIPPFSEGYKRILIVSNERVFSLFGDKLASKIATFNPHIFVFTFPQGENEKNKDTFEKLLTYMAEMNFDKKDLIVAFGGGTVSDIAGFSASVFKRGVPYVNVPTTLLSMSDAGIGGKTGIDFNGRKNLLGSIYQPKAVFCDTNFLETLDERQLASGYSEIIKSAIIGSEELFTSLENDTTDKQTCIYTALKIKKKYITKDVFDKDKRKILNFGHTLGHAVESLTNYTVTHGEAVAYGMVEAVKIAEKLKVCHRILPRLLALLNQYKININFAVDKQKAWGIALSDKKREGDYIDFVLPKRIGKCIVKSLPIEVLREAYLGY